MKEIKDINELRSIQLEALKDVHKFCKENNLRYFLAYGTLLGAVRHKGYIPWDDDIDIIMPRPDYEQFFKLYGNKTYEASCFKSNKIHPYLYGKVYDKRTILKENITFDLENGVYIDIFPLDGIPANQQEAQKLFRKIHRLKKVMNLKKNKINGGRRGLSKQVVFIILQSFVFFISYKWIVNKINNLAQRIPYNFANNYVSVLTEGGYPTVHLKRDCEDYTLMAFEGALFNVPKEYDKILTNIYGDYMQLPPESKRVSTHSFKAWWK